MNCHLCCRKSTRARLVQTRVDILSSGVPRTPPSNYTNRSQWVHNPPEVRSSHIHRSFLKAAVFKRCRNTQAGNSNEHGAVKLATKTIKPLSFDSHIRYTSTRPVTTLAESSFLLCIIITLSHFLPSHPSYRCDLKCDFRGFDFATIHGCKMSDRSS